MRILSAASKGLIAATTLLLAAPGAAQVVHHPTGRRIADPRGTCDFKQYVETYSRLWDVSKEIQAHQVDLPSIDQSDGEVHGIEMNVTFWFYTSLSHNYFILHKYTGNVIQQGWAVVGEYYNIRWVCQYNCRIDPATGTIVCPASEVGFQHMRLQRVDLRDGGGVNLAFTCDGCTVIDTKDFQGWIE